MSQKIFSVSPSFLFLKLQIKFKKKHGKVEKKRVKIQLSAPAFPARSPGQTGDAVFSFSPSFSLKFRKFLLETFLYPILINL